MRLFNRLTALALLGLAMAASAVVDHSYLQWQESGDTVPNSTDVRVYARVLKTGCTGLCDSTECADLTEALLYRAQGETSYTSLPMSLNMGDCYTPEDEYFADIPFAALSGDSVFFYCEFGDGDGVVPFTARPGSPQATFTAAAPAFYLVEDATSDDFVLHVTGDFHCVVPNGAGPGISGSFNGWNYQAMTNLGGGLYTYDIALPAGSASTIEFKFRNGTAWETLAGGPFANREFLVEPGMTEADYFAYWNDEEICPCIEAPLVNNQMVVFKVDMNNQDPATYAGGISLQGSRAPLTWDAGNNLMTDIDGDHIYTKTITFPAGTINSTEFKFTRSVDGTTWDWETTPNRFLCMLDNNFMVLDPVFWSDYVPPTETTVDVSLTFQVDLGCYDGVDGVSVQGSLAPLDWTAGSMALTDVDADGIWTGTVVFPAGSALDLEYKFAAMTDGVNWFWEDAIANRTYTLSDDAPVVTLDPVAFDDWFCAPELDIHFTNGNAVLTWSAVPTATSYNVYSSTTGYPELNLEANTAGTTYSVPATPGKKFFEVRAAK